MPAPIHYAHRLMERQAQLRKSGVLDWLRPDAKSQLTLRYENGKPVAIDAVVLSTQHAAEISQKEIHEARSEEHTSELQSRFDLVCRLLLEKQNQRLHDTHELG